MLAHCGLRSVSVHPRLTPCASPKLQVKDLRDLNDALANKQAEIAKYEANADKKSKDIQSTIETTVPALVNYAD